MPSVKSVPSTPVRPYDISEVGRIYNIVLSFPRIFTPNGPGSKGKGWKLCSNCMQMGEEGEGRGGVGKAFIVMLLLIFAVESH